MANHLLTFRPTGIHARAISGYHKPESNRRKSSTTSSSSASWWTPLFGVSSEDDYISSDRKNEVKKKRPGEPETGPVQKLKTSAGRLTEDKAKQLRVMTNKTSSFHDLMYHSAIASRLASDFKDAL